jgi:transposase
VPQWKSYRVTRDRAGRWHIAFAVVPDQIPAPGTGAVVGLDRGVAAAVTLSTGQLTSPGGLRPKQAERRVRLQRRLARQRQGSNRRARTRSALARLAAREVDRRKDWVEKTSTDLARRFDVIRVEDLDVRGMTRSARGTLEAPGRNVRAEAGLNREILKRGWGRPVTRIEQKASGRVEKIPAAYSSQRCNACGQVAAGSCESQARFRCVACGHVAHPDLNAAMNIADGSPAVGGRWQRVETG